MMEETITITGNQLGWYSFLLLMLFNLLAWAIPFRNLKQEKRLQAKRLKLRETQLERDKLCSEMINYKKETGYAFKEKDVAAFTNLTVQENILISELEN